MIPNPLGNENNPEEGGPVNDDVSETTTPTNKRNPRATRLEMERREKAILKMFKSHDELDVYQICDALTISYPQTNTVLSGMLDEGKIERAGIRSRKVMYRLPQSAAPAPTPALVPTPAQQVAPVALPLHLGEMLEITEISMTKEGIRVQARDNDEIFVFSLVD
jgi:hypothetical protein